MAISAPIEAKDELVETGLEALGALRQDPTPSRFCNCKAEMPLQWALIRQAAFKHFKAFRFHGGTRIASDSLVRCRRLPAATEA